jgi:hypothetical protein
MADRAQGYSTPAPTWADIASNFMNTLTDRAKTEKTENRADLRALIPALAAQGQIGGGGKKINFANQSWDVTAGKTDYGNELDRLKIQGLVPASEQEKMAIYARMVSDQNQSVMFKNMPGYQGIEQQVATLNQIVSGKGKKKSAQERFAELETAGKGEKEIYQTLVNEGY